MLEKRFHCENCPKKYTTAGSLKRHFNAFHLRIKKWSCYKCDRRFAAKREAQKHILFVHLEHKRTEGPKFGCDFCGKLFFNRLDLNKHLVRLSWCGK